MAKFRFHRGGFIESLATEVEVDNIYELIKAINKEFPNVKKDNVSIKPYCYDDRIGKQTYIVIYNDILLGFYTE